MGTLSEGQKINYQVMSEERGDKVTELSATE
jgi:cold shock CspA family protein